MPRCGPHNTADALRPLPHLTSIPTAWWVPTSWAGLVKGGTPGCSWVFFLLTVLPRLSGG